MKQVNKKWPTVSFIVCTLNSEATITDCLDSIQNLVYPKNHIRALVMDGGSTDNTLSIAKKYPICEIHKVTTNGPEEATAIGFNLSATDYVVNYSSDNVVRDTLWLKRMIAPLESNKNIVAAQSFRYAYVPNDKLLNRYFALFGMNDPVAFYLNKRDRSAYFESGWHLPTPVINHKDYFETTFNPENMPTLGANGFVIKTNIMQKVTHDVKKFSHIDTCVDLVNKGYTRFAFVKTELWHKTGESLSNYFRKRRKYALELYFKKMNMRRYHLYNPKTDRFKLILFIFYSLTFVEPLIQSLRGFIKIQDPAWFLHPLICFLITLNYIYITLRFKLFEVKKWIF